MTKTFEQENSPKDLNHKQNNTGGEGNNLYSQKSKNVNDEIKQSKPKRAKKSSSNIRSDSTLKNQNNNNNNNNKSYMMHLEVAVRVRPLTQREKDVSANYPKKRSELVRCQDNMVFLLPPEPTWTEPDRPERVYTFDTVFDPSRSNKTVYESRCQKLVNHIMDGYNATCFAYGMTGAGKTHTIFGNALESYTETTHDPGIYIMMINDLFNHMKENKTKKYAVKISFLEIYNENIKDLLEKDSHKKKNLKIQQDEKRGMVVSGLCEETVQIPEDVNELIRNGLNNRTVAATNSNEYSSRSHAILQMTIFQQNKTPEFVGKATVSKLSLIDLAGSERAASTKNAGMRMREGANINRSLLALGNCINSLSSANGRKKRSYVPFRDSKLTRLLKDSLGGNSYTLMIANVSPSWIHYEETHNTLKYAFRAKSIKQRAKPNRQYIEAHVSEYKEIIESLQSEVSELKNEVHSSNIGLPPIYSNQKKTEGNSPNPRINQSRKYKRRSSISSDTDLVRSHDTGNKEKESILSIRKQRKKLLYEISSKKQQLENSTLNYESQFEYLLNELLPNLEEFAEIKSNLQQNQDAMRRYSQLSRQLDSVFKRYKSQSFQKDQLEVIEKEKRTAEERLEQLRQDKKEIEQLLKQNQNERAQLKDSTKQMFVSKDKEIEWEIVALQKEAEKLKIQEELTSNNKNGKSKKRHHSTSNNRRKKDPTHQNNSTQPTAYEEILRNTSALSEPIQNTTNRRSSQQSEGNLSREERLKCKRDETKKRNSQLNSNKRLERSFERLKGKINEQKQVNKEKHENNNETKITPNDDHSETSPQSSKDSLPSMNHDDNRSYNNHPSIENQSQQREGPQQVTNSTEFPPGPPRLVFNENEIAKAKPTPPSTPSESNHRIRVPSRGSSPMSPISPSHAVYSLKNSISALYALRDSLQRHQATAASLSSENST